MPLTTCEYCGGDVSNRAITCRHCGRLRRIRAPAQRVAPTWKFSSIFVVILEVIRDTAIATVLVVLVSFLVLGAIVILLGN